MDVLGLDLRVISLHKIATYTPKFLYYDGTLEYTPTSVRQFALVRMTCTYTHSYIFFFL